MANEKEEFVVIHKPRALGFSWQTAQNELRGKLENVVIYDDKAFLTFEEREKLLEFRQKMQSLGLDCSMSDRELWNFIVSMDAFKVPKW